MFIKLSSGLVFLGLCLVCSSSHAVAAAAPTFIGTPTIIGVPMAGNELSICVSATDPQGLPLGITYNYGDGGTDTLGKHTYMSAGVYPVTVTISNGQASATITISVTINVVANLWIKKQSIKVSSRGRQMWRAQYIYNADRTLLNIFNPANDGFATSLGKIPIIQIANNGTGAPKFSGSKPRFVYKSAPGAVPSISVVLNESNQTITISASSAAATDIVPGVLRNMVQLRTNTYLVDQQFDAGGTFTANAGYRSTAFVVSAARVKVGNPGKDSAMLSLFLGDPGFTFPGPSTARTVRVRVFNVLNQIVLDKDLTKNVNSIGGKFKSTRDTATPSGTFTYDSHKGKMTFKLARATFFGLLTTSEEHVRVEVTIGDQIYSTNVTLFAARAGTYTTMLPKNFFNFIPGKVLDSLAPTVLATVPANSTNGVAAGASIAATFSEGMDPLKITTATFTLQQGTTAISGVVTYAGNIATFVPTSALASGTTFIATITTGAADLSGNPLVCNYAWAFTTAGQPVNPGDPTLTFDPVGAKALGDPDFLVHASSNSTGAITYSIQSGPATMSDATHVHITGVGTIVVLASQAADANFNAGSQTLSVPVTLGAVSAAQSTVSANPAMVAADGAATSTITVTLKDANGNFVSGKTVTLAQSSGPGAPIISAASGTSDAFGVVTFTVRSTTAGADGFTATDTTDNVTLTQTVTVTFLAGAVDALQSTVSANPTMVVADGVATSTITVTLKDINGNPVSGKTVTVAKTSGPGAPTISPAAGASDAVGVVTFTVRSTTVGVDLFAATDVTDGNLVLSQTVTVTFTTAPVALGAVAPFGTFGGGAGMTSEGTLTVVNGDIGTTGVSTTVTGFHDSTGDIYTETPLNIGQVNGRIYTDAPPPAHPGGLPVGGNAATKAIADQAAAAALDAYNKLTPAQLPGGMDPYAGHLGGKTVFPGVYKSASGTFDILGSDMTLDGQGDPNAVWVFQMASSLAVGAPGFPRSIILMNGAKPKNVFWQVGSAATINPGGGGTMVGTIIASSGVTFSTAGSVNVVTLEGRAVGLNASTTLVNTVINVPAP